MPIIPNEVLLLIAECIDDQRDYFRLLRVCRSWNALLLPIAYTRISIDDSQIYPLFGCIYRKPEIGKAIRDLNVQWSSTESDVEHDVGMAKNAVRRACDSSADRVRWKGFLRLGDSDAWLAVLVQSLEAVTSLSLDYNFDSDYFIPMLNRVANLDPPFHARPVLQRLERVTVATEDPKMAYDAADFLQLFRLPAMRTFSGDAICEAYEHESDPIYPKPDPGTSGIRELRLGGIMTRCNGSKGMADYITACANLEILEYQHTNMAIWGELDLSFQPGLFYAALVAQKHSLRELRMNDLGENTLDNCDDDDDEDNEHFNRFGSLAEFQHLRELRVPARTLLDFGFGNYPRASLHAILPQSLEYLHLCDCHEEDFDVIMADLKCVIEKRTDKFRNIKKLYIQLSDLKSIHRPTGGWTHELPVSAQQAFAPLVVVCHDAGIDFRLSRSV